MTEPSAALDVLIQRLPTVPLARHSYDCASMRSVDAACNCGWAEDRALTRLAADTLAAQAAQVVDLRESAFNLERRLQAQLAEVTAERDEARDVANRAHRRELKSADLLAERDAQVREAFFAGFDAGLLRGVEKHRALPMAAAFAAFIARVGAVGSVGAEPKET